MVRFRAEATAPALDAEFVTPDQIASGLQPADLDDVTEIELEARQVEVTRGPSRIAVTIRRPPRSSGTSNSPKPPVVTLNVTGADADWVELAARRMTEQLDKGARATPKVGVALAAGFVGWFALSLLILTVWGDELEGLNWAEIMAVVLGVLSGVCLLGILSLGAITPDLELLPLGGTTRWERVRQRLRFSGRWILDTVLKATIGAVIALAVARVLT